MGVVQDPLLDAVAGFAAGIDSIERRHAVSQAVKPRVCAAVHFAAAVCAVRDDAPYVPDTPLVHTRGK